MKNLLSILLLATFVVSAFAQTQEQSKILNTIKNQNKSITSFTASFTQTQHSPLLNDNKISKGEFYSKKPSQLALQYTEPNKDRMLINGEKMTMISNGKVHETNAKALPKIKDLRTVLEACINGDLDALVIKEIAIKKDANYHNINITLDKKEHKAFSKIELKYDLKTGVIASLKTIEKDGSYTLYELSKIKTNQTIDPKKFQK